MPNAATATESVRAPSPFKSYPAKIQRQLSIELIDSLSGVTDDAARASSALQGLAQLLEGCAPGHELQAGNLRELVEPICLSMDNVAADLAALLNVEGWHARAGALVGGAKGGAA